jgi:hypothetical protein
VIPQNNIRRLAYAQLSLFVVIWFLGIYINGFIPGPKTSAVSFLLVPVVTTHFVVGISLATIGAALFSLALKYKLNRSVLFSGLALALVAVAATGGLSFVFGIGDQNIDSMLMAVSFITALYLSFLAILNPSLKFNARSNPIRLSLMVLAFFYITFLSGMYANIFVASKVFSEPPPIAREMLGRLVVSPPMLLHETSGTLLFALTIAFTISLHRARLKPATKRGAIATILVGYSFFEGATMNILPILQQSDSINQNFISSTVAPLVSALGFLCAIIICMNVLESLATSKQTRQIAAA